VDIIPPTVPGTVFHLINGHLDLLADTLPYDAQQVKMLADIVRESGCGSGIIAGDFNPGLVAVRMVWWMCGSHYTGCCVCSKCDFFL
jgi:endonuclease/exonuclease/phosphatase (EEP) superfamily protein YafD